jgi:hypothetical protein
VQGRWSGGGHFGGAIGFLNFGLILVFSLKLVFGFFASQTLPIDSSRARLSENRHIVLTDRRL